MTAFLAKTGIQVPIIQAPMAGVSTPALAAAVSDAGALGSIAVGTVDARATRHLIAAVRDATGRPFNVNVFCHRPPVRDPRRESAWLARLAPAFAALGARPPSTLDEIYPSFVADDEKLAVLLETRPPIVSLHFGLPDRDRLHALRAAGIVLMATATSVAEAHAAVDAGIDIIVAQGIEAGGHRGVFDEHAADEALGALPLTRSLVGEVGVPVVTAGGVMDGGDVAACLRAGASAAQLGTAFIGCPESSADAAHRAALHGEGARHTVLTRAISGRPARGLVNELTALGDGVPPHAIPAYPVTYAATKALVAAAAAAGAPGFGVHWAGQGAARSRAMPAAQLVRTLQVEMEQALIR